MAEQGRGSVLKDALGFAAGAVLIVCCAVTLPQLPKAVDAIGPWPVWGGVFVVTIVAGWLFWSNVQKLYEAMRR
ncbi:putative protein OS=Tsukamurella paurometabola (strain ATCC 8368 / DSM / CCUG 35730 /CIP 100753 / JCM 10117 / KCTC 9821 / NBRC 16120 / NCIMB 702349/ NCTC 13040) OX=521096 GN=Tpau_4090 PE=4 SV=1 [Tsukamurella paurometabola]|uniref:Uncharacterized protein n=1 Tax=Tsukamurella paurometabola (strain ATCC 8368 / DSM 20162 / CCUG 35730 / CIP 100753 / JCM 10117 / KCTC 9821 / NBRC 16120 / NCIMB 702349 / NCTC 13040) TaxID=521096 RepID=D5UNG4_TSUPD|nr:hypothetical protein [Tsukamurella paurometabola]ADG80659.1 hypothetical protein Tpau_4090 [Tsukamurella paurometabola DSM 20162]SUP40467.1 Uncharacterised protein [Tsukamurella paurometabola]